MNKTDSNAIEAFGKVLDDFIAMLHSIVNKEQSKADSLDTKISTYYDKDELTFLQQDRLFEWENKKEEIEELIASLEMVISSADELSSTIATEIGV